MRNPESQIAVLRALWLGDMLCAVPALRALHHAYPAARITLIGLPWAREFAARFDKYLQGFVEFPGYPGLVEQPARVERFPEFLRQVQAMHLDLALQMHGSGALSNPLTLLLGARSTAGFFLPGQYCPDPDRYLPYPENEPEVVRLLRLLEHLEVPLTGEQLEFPLRASDYAELAHIAGARNLPRGTYVCIHPGARSSVRRWPVKHFARVADRLATQGFRIVITGSASEQKLARALARRMTAPALNLAGCTTLGALALLLHRAALLVCNDTGVSHLAAALRVPSVVLYLASNPQRWSPADRQQHRVVFAPVTCRPCDHSACPIGFPCAEQISEEEVWGQAIEALGKGPRAATSGPSRPYLGPGRVSHPSVGCAPEMS